MQRDQLGVTNMQSHFDAIVIGSGLNSLVCAAVLAKAGKQVCLLERESTLGGCIKSDSDSLPGFTFDLMSTSHVQFITSPAYAALADDLHGAGLEYCSNENPVGVITPEGGALVLNTDQAESVRRIANLSESDAAVYQRMLEDFGDQADVVFGLLGNEPWSWATAKILLQALRRRGVLGMISLFATLMKPTRTVVETEIESTEMKALLAPGCLHCGMSPGAPLSNLMGNLVTLSLAQAADPLVEGGSANLVQAFATLLERRGATLKTDADVVEIQVTAGRASGVRLANGDTLTAEHVIANVTPTQLYQRLLPAAPIPEAVAREAAAYRYGRSCLMMHIALKEKPAWVDEQMADVALLHVTPGLESVLKAVSEAERGLLPAEPTVCVVQPCAVDPSRAPEGQWILWLQLLEMPTLIKGDALGQIAPGDGSWTPEIKEAVGERIISDLEQVMPNLGDAVIWKQVLSPSDLETMNMNLVGGDPYSGDCAINQQLFFRPLPSVKNHQTPVKNLHQIGAATHPGPGLSGMSGFLVANALCKS